VCFQQYVEVCISNRKVPDIPCPAAECKTVYDASYILQCGSIRANVVQSYLAKSLEAHLYATKTRFIQCPSVNCGAGYVVDGNVDDKEGCCSIVNCWECKQDFCVDCIVSHPNMTCAESRAAKANDFSSRFIQNFTKNCPTCQTPITKNGGCNSMSCSRCKANFCWACMKIFATDTHTTCYNDMMRAEKELLQKLKAFQADIAKKEKEQETARKGMISNNGNDVHIADLKARLQHQVMRGRAMNVVDNLVGDELENMFAEVEIVEANSDLE